MKVVIKEELETLLPPISTEEYEGLKESLQENGQDTPIQTGCLRGNNDPFIIDGHNRYRLLLDIGRKPVYKQRNISFSDMNHVKIWMIDNQLARRNLSKFTRGECVLRRKDVISQLAKERMSLGGQGGIKEGVPISAHLKEKGKTRDILAKSAGIGHDTLNKIEIIAARASEDSKRALREDCDSKININSVYREILNEDQKKRDEELRKIPVVWPKGKYQTIVVDPPWPMKKIERDCAPNQTGFDYPTMTEEELMDFPLEDMACDNCHLYLWVTQKYMPLGLQLMERWGFKYQCQLTWVKDGGMPPLSWTYSTEHVLFGKRGNLPLLRLGKRLDFAEKRREHSRKPDIFYDLVKEVSPEPRIDVFSREERHGFDQFGNETDSL